MRRGLLCDGVRWVVGWLFVALGFPWVERVRERVAGALLQGRTPRLRRRVPGPDSAAQAGIRTRPYRAQTADPCRPATPADT